MGPVQMTLQTHLVYRVHVTFPSVCMYNHRRIYTEYLLSLWESTELRVTTFEYRTSHTVKLADKFEQGFTRRVRILAKNAYFLLHVCPSVCLYSCISLTPTKRIFVKFDIGGFFKKKKPVDKIHICWDKILGSYKNTYARLV